MSNYSQTIGEYTTGGATVNASLITASWPYKLAGVASDGNGHLFVAEFSTSNGGRISEYTTAGQVVNASLITNGLETPIRVALGGNGNIFVLNQANIADGSVGEYTTAGATVNASLITGVYDPRDLACDGNGNLYVAAGVVYKYATSGVLESNNLAPGFSQACSIALDGRGDFFVGGPDASYAVPVGEYTTSGAVVNASLLTGFLYPSGLQVGQTPEPSTFALLPPSSAF